MEKITKIKISITLTAFPKLLYGSINGVSRAIITLDIVIITNINLSNLLSSTQLLHKTLNLSHYLTTMPKKLIRINIFINLI